MSQAARNAEFDQACDAVLVSLLKMLIDKKILSNSEVRAVLTKAVGDLGPYEHVAPAKGAAGIILNDLLPRFPEDGGD
jgi:hypothetical protein